MERLGFSASWLLFGKESVRWVPISLCSHRDLLFTIPADPAPDDTQEAAEAAEFSVTDHPTGRPMQE